MSTSTDDPLGPDPLAPVAEELSAGNPAERAQRLLQIIEQDARHRLRLPSQSGRRAVLDGIDLGRDQCRARVVSGPAPPAWWDSDRQAIDLREADLRGASLRKADLEGALLEGADLGDADLAGAKLQGADLSGARLESALLEDSQCGGAILRFAEAKASVWEKAGLAGADCWGARLDDADLSFADLRGASLEEASCTGANLTGTDLREATLRRTNLQGANLQRADLRGAALGSTHLEGANLRDANLEDLDLSGCTLTGAHTAGARFEKTRLDRDQLGPAIGEELAREYGLARKGYLALERNFDELGDHDAARWAYRRRRRMEKREAAQKARAAWARGRWDAASALFLKYAGDQLVEWVCDYGEGIGRVFATLLFVYLLFIPAYGLSATVLRVTKTADGEARAPTYDPADLALFSLTAMTSPGNPPEYLVPRNEWGYLLSGVQTALGIFLTGLMGFVAGNRIRR